MSSIDLNTLPTWHNDEDNKTFHRLIGAFLAATVVFTLVVKVVELPEQTRAEKEKIPPQLVKIMERKVEVKPPEPEPIVEAEPEVIPEKEPEPEVIPEPEPKKIEPTKVEQQQKAKEKAQSSGLLALSDELSEMRDSVDVNSLADNTLVAGAGEAEQTERVLLGATAKGTSGGVSSSALSADVGSGSELEGRKTTEFTARVAGSGGGADEAAQVTESEIASGDRTTESIRKTFDKNKGALYSIYRRALRSDPSLQGSVTVKVVILPNGSVQSVHIITSEIDSAEFESKLIARIKLINFGSQDVNETELNYTFNFLPF